MKVGKHTYGNNEIIVKKWPLDKSELIIGNFCSIAPGLKVQLGGNHRTDWISTFPFPAFHNIWNKSNANLEYAWSKGDVVIGNDVWIGEGVTILSGVKIGDGAVLGAHTVIAKDVPPYAIVVGNPGEIKKYRFNKDQIEKLLSIKWWNWSDEEINENVNLLCSNNIDDFISKHFTLL